MAYFYVTIETIKTIDPIEGADRIQRATLEGLPFQFVIGKDIYKVGERVLYFPIDALIPADVAQKMGVYGKLAGKAKDRVKTIRLRNCISQGVVGPLSLLGPIDLIESLTIPTPEGITAFLRVVKYEPPSILEKGANLRALPCNLTIYDIEGCERNSDVVEFLKPHLCYISEKVEGSNFSVSYDGTKIWVNQRRHTIELLEGAEKHTWWKIAEEQNLTELAKKLYAEYGLTATLYGEMTGPGIQGNIYKLPSHKIFVFDIKLGEDFMNASDFIKFTTENNINTAPSLGVMKLEDFLAPFKSVIEASTGNSLIYPGTLREGIVIKPITEQRIDRFGRAIIKQRDPIYLAGNEN